MSLTGLNKNNKLFFENLAPKQGHKSNADLKIKTSGSFLNDSLQLSKKENIKISVAFGSLTKPIPKLQIPSNPVSLNETKTYFVKTENGKFTIDNKPFKFIGTNMYSLAKENPVTTEKMIRDAANEGFTVIRFWAKTTTKEKLQEVCDHAKKYNE